MAGVAPSARENPVLASVGSAVCCATALTTELFGLGILNLAGLLHFSSARLKKSPFPALTRAVSPTMHKDPTESFSPGESESGSKACSLHSPPARTNTHAE